MLWFCDNYSLQQLPEQILQATGFTVNICTRFACALQIYNCSTWQLFSSTCISVPFQKEIQGTAARQTYQETLGGSLTAKLLSYSPDTCRKLNVG